MSKPVILTGLRANNDLHIGNYLGAILPMVDMAREHSGEYQINFFVPDLHSFTTPIDHSKLFEQTLDNIKMYVAAGLPLDNEDIHVYRQSFIPSHSELTWILSCFTGFGEMSRMTQFKDKSGVNNVKIIEKAVDRLSEYGDLGDKVFADIESAVTKESELRKESAQLMDDLIRGVIAESSPKTTVGLFSYPVLMAADILLYGAKYVPVGDDQTQHLEFTRDIAERMNRKFGELFSLPLPVRQQHEFFGKDQGLRIRDLVDPSKKMSKSDETGKGVLFLQDSPEAARKKIMAATTDSKEQVERDYDNQPGISNLLDILELLGGDVDRFIGQKQYGPLKTEVADRVAGFLENFQARLADVNEGQLLAKLETSESTMREQAALRLDKVQIAVGLRAVN